MIDKVDKEIEAFKKAREYFIFYINPGDFVRGDEYSDDHEGMKEGKRGGIGESHRLGANNRGTRGRVVTRGIARWTTRCRCSSLPPSFY